MIDDGVDETIVGNKGVGWGMIAMKDNFQALDIMIESGMHNIEESYI